MIENSAIPAVSFDLDEDSVPDTLVTDTNADGIPDQTTTAFDLDNDSVPDTIVTDTNADGIPDQTTTTFDLDDSASWGPTASDDWTPADGPDDAELDEDSFTPPEHITDADVGQAMQDVQHSQAMNQYMQDCGVIS
jgi:hypothetical protein